MGAILQDLILTHPTDLTQRTARKTVSVRGQVIGMAQIKRCIRRNGLPAAHAAPLPPASTICLADAIKACPSLSAPDQQPCPPVLPSSNPRAVYPPDAPFDAQDARQGRLTFQHPNTTAQERTWSSTLAHGSISGQER